MSEEEAADETTPEAAADDAEASAPDDVADGAEASGGQTVRDPEPAGAAGEVARTDPAGPSVTDLITSPAGLEEIKLHVGLYALLGLGVGVAGLTADTVASGVSPVPTGAGQGLSAAVTGAAILSVNVLAVGLAAVFGLRIEEELFEMDLAGVYGVAAVANGLGALVMGAVGGLLAGGGTGAAAAVSAAVVAGVAAAVVGTGAVWLTTSGLVREPGGPPPVEPTSNGSTAPEPTSAPEPSGRDEPGR